LTENSIQLFEIYGFQLLFFFITDVTDFWRDDRKGTSICYKCLLSILHEKYIDGCYKLSIRDEVSIES
jgi:hypothetical protein